MKKTLITFMLIFASSSAFAQDCYYSVSIASGDLSTRYMSWPQINSCEADESAVFEKMTTDLIEAVKNQGYTEVSASSVLATLETVKKETLDDLINYMDNLSEMAAAEDMESQIIQW